MPSEGQAQKFAGKILLILALALIVNSVYMTAFGGPNFFDVLNGLLHPLLGIATAFLFVLYLIRNRRTFGGALGSLSVALLAGAGALGIYLALVGMTRPHRESHRERSQCATKGSTVSDEVEDEQKCCGNPKKRVEEAVQDVKKIRAAESGDIDAVGDERQGDNEEDLASEFLCLALRRHDGSRWGLCAFSPSANQTSTLANTWRGLQA